MLAQNKKWSNISFHFNCFQTKEIQIRKYSPILESDLITGNGVLPSNEWKTVPDIWRISAEKFGDHVALVDPYHNPATNMTYKQVGWGSLFLYVLYPVNISCYVVILSTV